MSLTRFFSSQKSWSRFPETPGGDFGMTGQPDISQPRGFKHHLVVSVPQDHD